MEGFHPWFSLLIIINDYIIVVTRFDLSSFQQCFRRNILFNKRGVNMPDVKWKIRVKNSCNFYKEFIAINDFSTIFYFLKKNKNKN